MGQSHQVQKVITEFDKSPLIEVMTWLFLSMAIVSTIARTATKMVQVGSLKLDDHMAFASVVCIGRCIKSWYELITKGLAAGRCTGPVYCSTGAVFKRLG
jgi:hypothetical protein